MIDEARPRERDHDDRIDDEDWVADEAEERTRAARNPAKPLSHRGLMAPVELGQLQIDRDADDGEGVHTEHGVGPDVLVAREPKRRPEELNGAARPPEDRRQVVRRPLASAEHQAFEVIHALAPFDNDVVRRGRVFDHRILVEPMFQRIFLEEDVVVPDGIGTARGDRADARPDIVRQAEEVLVPHVEDIVVDRETVKCLRQLDEGNGAVDGELARPGIVQMLVSVEIRDDHIPIALSGHVATIEDGEEQARLGILRLRLCRDRYRIERGARWSCIGFRFGSVSYVLVLLDRPHRRRVVAEIEIEDFHRLVHSSGLTARLAERREELEWNDGLFALVLEVFHGAVRGLEQSAGFVGAFRVSNAVVDQELWRKHGEEIRRALFDFDARDLGLAHLDHDFLGDDARVAATSFAARKRPDSVFLVKRRRRVRVGGRGILQANEDPFDDPATLDRRAELDFEVFGVGSSRVAHHQVPMM
mmetsp:Transcript_8668/g.22121  ORF Transcript_8668/g.22121 Transcript_8668/m.22121 type:complete len:475 (+) Transcript_8668:1338-2762(+)